jgi:hypothetical protein
MLQPTTLNLFKQTFVFLCIHTKKVFAADIGNILEE